MILSKLQLYPLLHWGRYEHGGAKGWIWWVMAHPEILENDQF
jgi:hypothetical protein